MQICSGRRRVQSAVDESYQVGKMVIAEQSGYSFSAELNAPRFVHVLGICGYACGIAKKPNIEGSPQDSFVGAEPLEAFLNGQGQSLIRNRSFGGPKSHGLGVKNAFMVQAAPPQLLTRVFRMAEGAARLWRSGIGYAGNVRVAQQRKNRMV